MAKKFQQLIKLSTECMTGVHKSNVCEFASTTHRVIQHSPVSHSGPLADVAIVV